MASKTPLSKNLFSIFKRPFFFLSLTMRVSFYILFWDGEQLYKVIVVMESMSTKKVVESYTFVINYTDADMAEISFSRGKNSTASNITVLVLLTVILDWLQFLFFVKRYGTKKSLQDQAKQLIKYLIPLISGLDPLDTNDIKLQIFLEYHTEVTPPSYEPPGFERANNKGRCSILERGGNGKYKTQSFLISNFVEKKKKQEKKTYLLSLLFFFFLDPRLLFSADASAETIKYGQIKTPVDGLMN
ncbi:hypothetical protein RFI_20681 [Reticulomyxa filosa]|uniref:HORMA domain-containing protein n=1 Tax=Reticulomyxa filosa TaxID=46433 RepID=X6MS36_RETFI|nr:hypothetical protein RFI_20681 [Reticulomyxa filosa]|eukprot:ETO16659.1 hypothetical protein RFI_20681 [Reticulomyxa filosa]